MDLSKRETVRATTEYETVLAGLYEECYDRIARYVYGRIGDRAAAEDIAGEVFLKALQSLGSYREQGIPMQAWLFRIAHNMLVDHLRKKSKYRMVPIDSVTEPHDSGLEEQIEKKVEMETVLRAMTGLTPDQREVVNLRFFGGLSSKEVGSVLGKSDGAVREMQRAAMEKLRGILGIKV